MEMQNKELLLAKEQAEIATAKYVELYEFAPSGNFLLSRKGEIIQLNIEGSRIFGRVRSQLINRRFGFFISDDTRPIFNHFIDKVFSSNTKEMCDLSISTPNSLPVHVHVTGIVEPVKDLCFVTVVEITELILAQEKIKELNVKVENRTRELLVSNNKLVNALEVYRTLSDNSPDSVDRFDQEFRHVFINEVAAAVVGKLPDEVIGRTSREIGVPEEMARQWEEYLRIVFETGEPMNLEYSFPTEQGIRFFGTRCVPERSSDGTVQTVLAISRDMTERKKLEDVLKESEEKFRLLFENMAEGFSLNEIITDENDNVIDFRLLEANAAYEYHTGLNPRESMGKTLLEVMPQANLRQIENYGKVALTGEPLQFEYFSQTFQRYMRVRAFRPQPKRFATIFEDISESKKLEIELRESEKKFREISQYLDNGYYSVTLDGVLLEHNHAFNLIFGFDIEKDLKGYKTSDLLQDQEERKQYLHALHTQGSIRNFTVNAKKINGEKIFLILNSHLVKDEKDIPVKIEGAIIDITERKHLEESLIESQFDLNDAQQKTGLGSWSYDPVSQQPKWSKEMFNIWGLDPELGAPNYALHKKYIHPDDFQIFDKLVQCALEKGEPFVLEKRICRPDKSERTVITICEPVIDKTGKIIQLKGTNQDITERKQAEAELKFSNDQLAMAISERDKFFSIIAHDLRGPLGGFLTLTEMFANEDHDFTDSEKKEMISALSHSARSTFTLLENLLEWSKTNRGISEFKPQKLGLTDLVTECINIFADPARGKGIALVADIPTGREVFADKNMFQTVIRNLLSNAIKFTPKGGLVSITAKPAENNMIVISVKDTGIGMSEKMRNDLFCIDARTKRPGTEGEHSSGLGLLLSKEFVGKQGGEIWIDSEQLKGTIFSFTVPSAGQKGNEIANQQVEFIEKPTGKINNLKILIAEDDEISAKLISVMVKSFSREVLQVITGTDAVQLTLSNPDINLILMDIAMPELDGYEATRQIRQFNQEVVIIAQTTFALPADKEKAMAAGCNDYISKPINKTDLIELIKKHIHGKAD